jgi:hypothetical protein
MRRLTCRKLPGKFRRGLIVKSHLRQRRHANAPSIVLRACLAATCRPKCLIGKTPDRLDRKETQMTDLAKDQNRAHLEKGSVVNRMTPMNADGGVAGSVRGAGPNDLPPSIRGDAPMMVGPHDGGRLRNDNASTPTRVATHIQNASPGYTGISPRVAAELYKAPPAFGQRIRDHTRRK